MRSIQYLSNKQEILYLANREYYSNAFIKQKIDVNYVRKIIIFMIKYGLCNMPLFKLYVRYIKDLNKFYWSYLSQLFKCSSWNNLTIFENHEQLINLRDALKKYIIKDISYLVIEYAVTRDRLLIDVSKVQYRQINMRIQYIPKYIPSFYIMLKLETVYDKSRTNFNCSFSSTMYPGIEFVINNIHHVHHPYYLHQKHTYSDVPCSFIPPKYNIGMYFSITYKKIMNISPTKKVMSKITSVTCYQ